VPRKKKFDMPKEIRAIARERVGTVKAERVIVPKAERKPKYKKDLLREDVAEKVFVYREGSPHRCCRALRING
jgi:hypothetical protein